MKIFNLHGYHGSSQNAACGVLSEMGHDIVSPSIDYDSFKPEYIAQELSAMIQESQPDIIVGTSLGGFFALYLAIGHGLPVVLVNPCLMPFLHLPRLGYEGDIRGFVGMFSSFTRIDQNRTRAVIGGCDEVIDTHDFTRNLVWNCTVVPEGMHSGATLNLKSFFTSVIDIEAL